MSTGLGIKGIMGLAKQTAYETAVDATDKVLFLSEGIQIEDEFINHEYLYGGAGTPDTDLVFTPVVGPVEAVIPYTEKNGSAFVSTDSLIALAMGTATWVAAQTNNTVTFADNLEVNGTVAVDKGINSGAGAVWESIGTMINAMTISGSAGEFISASFEVQSKQLKIASTQNTPTEMLALPDDIPSLLSFSDLTFRIGDQANALGAGDNTGISSFTLSINNNLSEPQQSTPAASLIDAAADTYVHSDAKQPIKPRRNGFRECTLEITMPRYEADTFLDFRSNETNLQAQFTFTDGTNSFWIYLPNLKITAVSAPIAGAEAIEQTITLTCLRYNSHGYMTFQDGSTTDDGEVWIEMSNERTAVITGF